MTNISMSAIAIYKAIDFNMKTFEVPLTSRNDEKKSRLFGRTLLVYDYSKSGTETTTGIPSTSTNTNHSKSDEILVTDSQKSSTFQAGSDLL
ncbi:hypothetical protein CAEBREN_24319 [Caenorhabditis brenneri]|uniref:Uncharacterized protein n=1 Tax=Caenorhabditis brenneri TaxID=135651 RepID=G0NST8_CAEBE|nr:hypothetical protein CAEBREN_24319 [Caenorhabditis brenneri]